MQCSRWAAVLGDWAWFLGFALASSAWCVSVAGEIGVTFDEPVYLSGGLAFWRTGSHYPLFKLGTMPLPMDVATLPLYVWERVHDVTFDFDHGDPYQPLFWARVTTLIFWWLLLIYARLMARSLAGPWAGRLVVALLAVEPSFLAHASLATSDLAITATMVAFLYHFRTGRDRGWLGRVGWPSLWFAIALLCKASAIAFAPLCMIAVEVERLARLGALSLDDGIGVHPRDSLCSSGGAPRWRHWPALAWQQLRPLRRDGLQALALGTALAFIYGGSDWQPQRSTLTWAQGLPPGPFADAMVWTAEHLRVFSNAGEPILRQISHNFRGHGAYLLGRVDPVSIWYYFPVVLSIKLTVPLLVLPLVVAVIRPRALLNWACIAAGVLLVYTLNCKVQIGVRLVLPLVGIGMAGLAAAYVHAWRAMALWPPRLFLAACLGLGIAWSAASCIAVWPHGLCYVNELWGGTQNGYLVVSDGNYDWGQGVPDLARWVQRHGTSAQGRTLDVLYFGTDPAIDLLPVRKVQLYDILALKTEGEVEAALAGRRLAVSTTAVHGSGLNDCAIIRHLQRKQATARTQTFLIYDFSLP